MSTATMFQAEEIEYFYRKFSEAGHSRPKEKIARLWIKKYANSWRAWYNWLGRIPTFEEYSQPCPVETN